MTFSGLIALALAVWLLSCGASVLAVYWNIVTATQRLWAAFISSCLALLIGYFGLSRIHLKGSKTVNGHLVWSYDSRWFFIGALVLAGASLALTFWNWRKANRRLEPGLQAGEASGHSADEPGAAPKSSPATPLANSEAGGGPPSVS